MANASLVEFHELPSPVESVRLRISKDWPSTTDERRLALRQRLAEVLKIASPDLHRWTRDLNVLPVVADAGVSIAHSEGLAGFAHALQVGEVIPALGLDIEAVARLRPEVIKRVSSPVELQAAGEFSHYLWVAKEASFKFFSSLRRGDDSHSLTLSQIQIYDWHARLDPRPPVGHLWQGLKSYRAKLNLDRPGEEVLVGHGVVWSQGDHLISLCFNFDGA